MMSAAIVEQFQEIFRCPVCKEQMQMIHLQSLVCSNRHCFDIAKQGYINLFYRANKTKYEKKIFECRRIISRSGFFDPLYAVVSGIIINQLRNNESASILDAGCGEGSHLINIQEQIFQKRSNPLLAVGIDISKEGVGIAAAEYSNAAWCVADIANCPFANHRFNFILNILSPANYSEFQRMVAVDGMVIKVIPEQGYLKELREIFYEGSEKHAYSNELTLNHFKQQFKETDVKCIRYQVNLSEPLIEPLIGMTPLSWGTSRERLQKVQEMNLQQVTMDFKILVGKK
jgi:23S rRNA (guanine745-N1)-methyltransferase